MVNLAPPIVAVCQFQTLTGPCPKPGTYWGFAGRVLCASHEEITRRADGCTHLWLTPLWLMTMLPAADWLAGRRWGRVVAYLLLGASVLSASYPALNPWRHPWLYNFMESLGWNGY